MSVPLITKYRPTDFDEMVGHEAQLGALRRALVSDSCPHAFLFTGVAGLGKTTLARIVARVLEAEVIEIDAASHSSVDAMRELVEVGNHMSLTGAGRRLFLIDECHALSKQAWQALLKILEEPPPHLFLALCTTEHAKVPETIVTRCFHVALRPLSDPEITDLVLAVAGAERWDVRDDVVQAVVQAATGQPRKSLSILQAVHDAASRDEVKRIIALLDDSDAIMKLAKLLVSGQGGWEAIRKELARIGDDEFEDASIPLGRYIATVMVKEENPARAKRLWTLLDALVWPTTTYDRKVAFYTAIGRMLWAGEG